MSLFASKKEIMVQRESALPGREQLMPVAQSHYVNGNPMQAELGQDQQQAVFGLGCFWGAERKFWQLSGVFSTAAGYSAGYTPNPSYEEVCSGLTGHNEVVKVVFDTSKISYQQLLQCFFESHDPTQGMRQGNDRGTQYRSGIYTTNDEQKQQALAYLQQYQQALNGNGYGAITTEVLPLQTFYYAEDYHQQYLAKNPGGYCGLGGTGVACPVGLQV